MLAKIIKGRRSIRTFKNESISKKIIDKILEAGTWAPSACNAQQWRFLVINNQEVKEKLVNSCSSPKIISNSAFTIFVLYDRNTTTYNNANIQSGAAATQNMLLRAYELGIGSLWMCNYGNPTQIYKLLKIPSNFMILNAVCFGYPLSRAYPPKRRENVISYNSFAEEDRFLSISKIHKWTLEQIKDHKSFRIHAKSPQSQEYLPQLKQEFGSILRVFPKIDGNVLDVFPFLANFSHELVKRNKIKNLTICEMSEEINQFLKEKFSNNAKFVCCLNKLNVREKFDAITFFKSAEELPDPRPFFIESNRVSKSNGRLYVLFTNTTSIYGLYFNYLKYRLILPRIIPGRTFTFLQMKKMINKAGFKINKVTGFCLCPKTKLEGIRFKNIFANFCKSILLECSKS